MHTPYMMIKVININDKKQAQPGNLKLHIIKYNLTFRNY